MHVGDLSDDKDAPLSILHRILSNPRAFAGQAVMDTPVQVDGDDVLELPPFCNSDCDEVKSD